MSLVGASPNLLVVDPELNISSVKEFVALAKSQPGKLNYGSVGNGSTSHLTMELLKEAAGLGTSNESNSMNQLDGSILMRFRQREWISACRRNRRCTMRLPLLLAIAALGFAGCASAPKSELATSYDDGVDRARMTIIEERAARSGVRVFWMNPPRKPSTPSGG